MYRNVDADYYGYRDEEDGVLVPLEKAVEDRGTRARAQQRARACLAADSQARA